MKNIINLKNLFLFTFFAYSFFFPLSISELANEYPIYSLMYFFRNISLILSSLLIFVKRMRMENWLKYFILGLIMFVSGMNSGNFRFFTLMIFCFYIDEINFEAILKSLGIGNLIGAIVVVLLSLTGIIQNNIVYDTGRYRLTFGFILPVLLPGIVLNIGYIFVYLNRGKLTFKKVLSMLILGFIVYSFALGRASFLVLAMLLIGTYIIQLLSKDIRKKISTLLARIIKVAYLFVFAFSIFVGISFHTSLILQSWNTFFTGRLGWFSLYWDLYTPQLFGQYIIQIGQITARETGISPMILDNAALTLLLENGIVITLIFTILLFSTLDKLREKADYASLMIWLAIIITFPIATNGLWIWRNPLLLQFAFVINNKKYINHNKPSLIEQSYSNNSMQIQEDILIRGE